MSGAPTVGDYKALVPASGRRVGGARAASARPAVSVVTVVFNGAATLRRTIESVRAQRAAVDVEYVVIDGGSTDGTLEILAEYDADIDRWISEPDGGLYDAMNKGIALTRGSVVGLLNADDWYLDGALAAVAAAAGAHPEGGVLYGAIDHETPGRAPVRFWPPSALRRADFHSMPIPHAATFVRRAVYEDVGLFRRDLRLAGDYEFVLRCFAGGVRFAHIPRALTGVQAGGLSDTHTRRYEAENRRVLLAYGLGWQSLLRHHTQSARVRVVHRLRESPLGWRALAAYRRLRGRGPAPQGGPAT